MKEAILISILFIQLSSFGQTESKLGIDCNPKPNFEEIQFLRKTFVTDSFNFEDKNIGFATNSGFKTWGFENSFLPISKKEYFKVLNSDSKQKFTTKLIVLDGFQKQVTKGFDAIILVFDKKYQSKANKSSFKRIITAFGYRELNYPDNLHQVGNDTSSVLSTQDADFFNQIFKVKRGAFNFNGKKIAIVRTQTKSIISKDQFIDKVKKHLENDFLYPYDFLYIFNDKEKKESGGYEAVIIYDCLKCGGGDAVAILKKNGT